MCTGWLVGSSLKWSQNGSLTGLGECAISHKSCKGQVVPKVAAGFCLSYSAPVGLTEATTLRFLHIQGISSIGSNSFNNEIKKM